MQKKLIVAIIGEPGLYELLENSKKYVIIKSIEEKQKTKVKSTATIQLMLLSDIKVYTTGENESIELSKLFDSIKNIYSNKLIPSEVIKDKKKTVDLFLDALPNYDKNKVKLQDMKKIFSWYNILIKYEYSYLEK